MHLTGTTGIFSFLLCYYATVIPSHSFLPANDTADELARWGTLLQPSTAQCSLSPLTYLIYSSLCLNWRHTVSSKFFNTQYSSVFTEELVLPRHTRSVLSPIYCNEHSLLLNSCISGISRTESASCSICGHPNQGRIKKFNRPGNFEIKPAHF